MWMNEEEGEERRKEGFINKVRAKFNNKLAFYSHAFYGIFTVIKYIYEDSNLPKCLKHYNVNNRIHSCIHTMLTTI